MNQQICNTFRLKQFFFFFAGFQIFPSPERKSIFLKNWVNMLNDYPDNSRHNMTKNSQNPKFYFFESDPKTNKEHL